MAVLASRVLGKLVGSVVGMSVDTVVRAATVAVPVVKLRAMVARMVASPNNTTPGGVVRVTVTSAGGMSMVGDDFDTSVVAYLPGPAWSAVSGEASAWVSLSVLRKALRAHKGTVGVTVGAGKVTVGGIPLPVCETDLPVYAATRPPVLGVVSGADLAHVASAMSADTVVPTLCGVLADRSDGTLALVATDRFRLHTATVNQQRVCDDGKTWLGRDIVRRMVAVKPVGAVTVHGGDTLGQLRGVDRHGIRWVVSARHESRAGTFPKWRQLIPSSHGWEYRADVADMQAALAAVSCLVSRGKTRSGSRTITPVRLDASYAGTGRLHVVRDDDAEAESTLAGKVVDGNPPVVGLNPDYLKDLLSGMSGDVTIVGQDDAHRPIVVLPASNPNHTALLMPVKID